MEQKTVDIESFYIAGIAVRTTNQAGQAAIDLGELWGKFMGNNLAAGIENKLSDDVYSVYTEYESDYTGFYTTIIGCKVSTIKGLSGGFTGVEIPAGKYNVYEPQGELPMSVVSEWEDIWDSEIDRTYGCDFELYHTDETGICKVEIYVGIQ